MIIVATKFDLKTASKEEMVYVRSVGKLYCYMDGDWVEKMYFSRREVSVIIKVPFWRVHKLAEELDVGKRITVSQLQMLAKADRMSKQKMKFADIKRELL